MKQTFFALVLVLALCASAAHAQTTNIFDAARADDVKTVQALLDAKADINQVNESGYTPLTLASYNGNYDVAQFLLDHGAATEKKDASGRTALMGVSFKGEDREVELLLQHGADPNAEDAHGMTSMMYAVMFGKLSVVKILHANEASKSAAASAPSN